MEKAQDKENNFLKKLMTPAGFVAAIAVSLGLGFGIAFFRTRLGKRELSEYEKVIQRIREKMKENKGDNINPYSDEVIKMVYDAVPLVDQGQFNTAFEKILNQKLAVLEDFQKYMEVTRSFSVALFENYKTRMYKVVEDAGGSVTEFSQIEAQRSRTSPHLQECFDQGVSDLKTNYSKSKFDKNLTDEVLREAETFYLELFKRIDSEKIYKNFIHPLVTYAWACDYLRKKFGVDLNTKKYKAVRKRLAETDPEFGKLQKEIDRVCAEVERKFKQ